MQSTGLNPCSVKCPKFRFCFAGNSVIPSKKGTEMSDILRLSKSLIGHTAMKKKSLKKKNPAHIMNILICAL